MKKPLITFVIITIMTGSAFIGCRSSSEKVENAQENLIEAENKVVDAKQDLNEALNDSIQQFRRESDAKIIAHEKSISDFKARIAKEKIQNRAKYEKKLAELENKSTDLKKKLDDYKESGKEQWEKFKIEFNNELDEMGNDLKSFSTKNTK